MKFGKKAMEKDNFTTIFRPLKPHFFKPLLPSCLSQINIPSVFFSKYLSSQKKKDQVVMRTSYGEWTVKIEGQKIGNGWEKIVRDNCLDIGDFVVFKPDKNMVFDVGFFDPSACEKEFPQLNNNKILQHGTSPSLAKSMKKKSTYTNSMEKSGISRSGYPYFVSKIKADCLNRCRFHIPLKFARENGLERKGDITLRDFAQKRSWTLGINKNGSHTRLVRGWCDFRKEIGLKLGDYFMLELIRKGNKPVANFIITN